MSSLPKIFRGNTASRGFFFFSFFLKLTSFWIKLLNKSLLPGLSFPRTFVALYLFFTSRWLVSPDESLLRTTAL